MVRAYLGPDESGGTGVGSGTHTFERIARVDEGLRVSHAAMMAK